MPKEFSFSKAARARQGYSIIEVMIAAVVFIVVVGSLMAVSVFVSQDFKALTNYDDLDTKSRHALDSLSADIRNAAGVSMSVYRTNNITLTNADGSAFSYQWNPSDTTLKRYYTNADGTHTVTVMLTNCDTLTFYLYLQVPTNGLTFTTTTNSPNDAKLINVDWRCSRDLRGSKLNTESVQTAQITLRN